MDQIAPAELARFFREWRTVSRDDLLEDPTIVALYDEAITANEAERLIWARTGRKRPRAPEIINRDRFFAQRQDPESIRIRFRADSAHVTALFKQTKALERDLSRVGKKVAGFKTQTPEIEAYVAWAANLSWSKPITSGPPVISEATLSVLDEVASAAERQKQERSWGEAYSEIIRTQLDEIAAVMGSDLDMDEASRIYIASLIDEVRNAVIDVQRYGSAQVRKVSNELAGVLLGEAVKARYSGSPVAQKFLHAALAIVTVTGTTVYAHALEVTTEVALKRLGIK
jgi:hypothetical protein